MNPPHPLPYLAVEELSSSSVLGPIVPELSPKSVHIWEFPLTTSDVPLDKYADLLSKDERARAACFHFEKDARRFSVARASVRSILGGYTGSPSRGLRFDYSRYGKPSLAGAATDIRFSVSHSGELAMLAVSLGREVGVDLELIREKVETDKLAERYFSEQERAALRALSNGQRIQAFFRCWTCKEAFLKAQGLGLSRSLESFDVEVNPALPARLLATRPDADAAARWFLHDIQTQSEYAAAIVSEGPITAMKVQRCR
jgi:4'-phosphopantetheinyl transferase